MVCQLKDIAAFLEMGAGYPLLSSRGFVCDG